jgi:hypothetical protein
VLLKQRKDAVDLLVAPATQPGSFLELAFHGVPFGSAPGGQRATVASRPGVRKAEEPDSLRDLVGIYVDTREANTAWNVCSIMGVELCGSIGTSKVRTFPSSWSTIRARSSLQLRAFFVIWPPAVAHPTHCVYFWA